MRKIILLTIICFFLSVSAGKNEETPIGSMVADGFISYAASLDKPFSEDVKTLIREACYRDPDEFEKELKLFHDACKAKGLPEAKRDARKIRVYLKEYIERLAEEKFKTKKIGPMIDFTSSIHTMIDLSRYDTGKDRLKIVVVV